MSARGLARKADPVYIGQIDGDGGRCVKMELVERYGRRMVSLTEMDSSTNGGKAKGTVEIQIEQLGNLQMLAMNAAARARQS